MGCLAANHSFDLVFQDLDALPQKLFALIELKVNLHLGTLAAFEYSVHLSSGGRIARSHFQT
jgi:hypothetical protein